MAHSRQKLKKSQFGLPGTAVVRSKPRFSRTLSDRTAELEAEPVTVTPRWSA